MAAPATRPSDLTGTQRQKALKEHEAEVLERQNEMTMVNRATAEREEHEVIDLANPFIPVAVAEEEVELNEEWVKIRVNEACKPTIAKKTYEFEVGTKYRVPKHVADHLEERGIIWH